MRWFRIFGLFATFLLASRPLAATVIEVPLRGLQGVYLQNGQDTPGQRTVTRSAFVAVPRPTVNTTSEWLR